MQTCIGTARARVGDLNRVFLEYAKFTQQSCSSFSTNGGNFEYVYCVANGIYANLKTRER